eukprot:6184397-Pleurochrysis_carterae.AAC.1
MQLQWASEVCPQCVASYGKKQQRKQREDRLKLQNVGARHRGRTLEGKDAAVEGEACERRGSGVHTGKAAVPVRVRVSVSACANVYARVRASMRRAPRSPVPQACVCVAVPLSPNTSAAESENGASTKPV